MCRMPPADHRQVPAQSHRRPLARGVCAVRGVRGRAHGLLLPAGPQTLLQAGLRRVSADPKLFITVWFVLMLQLRSHSWPADYFSSRA